MIKAVVGGRKNLAKGRNSKKFIDKKHDKLHTFKVVHRSQRDPLAVDEDAPQAVLVDTECEKQLASGQDALVDTEERDRIVEQKKYGIYFDDGYNYLQHIRGVDECDNWNDYDFEIYTMKSEKLGSVSQVSNKDAGLVLPSSVFESFVEEKEGFLNRATAVIGPQPDLDPDIVAALDDDSEQVKNVDFYAAGDDGFPDDFIMALDSCDNNVNDDTENDNNEYSNIETWLDGTAECYEDLPIFNGLSGSDFHPNTSQTETDFSSDDGSEASVDGLNVSDDEDEKADKLTDLPFDNLNRFNQSKNVDKFFDSFNESEKQQTDVNLSNFEKLSSNSRKKKRKRASSIGSSRTSASAATVPRTELLSTLDERFEVMFDKEFGDDRIGALDGEVIEGTFDINSELFQQSLHSTIQQFEKIEINACEEKNRTIDWIKNHLEGRNPDDDERKEMVLIEFKSKPEFDCESILSTYSNTKNLPRLIDDRKLFDTKKSKLTIKALKKFDHENDDEPTTKDAETATILSCISALSFRPPNETTEQRRDRKTALRELRRERRQEKKQNKLLFKEEIKKQKKFNMSLPKGRMVPVV